MTKNMQIFFRIIEKNLKLDKNVPKMVLVIIKIYPNPKKIVKFSKKIMKNQC